MIFDFNRDKVDLPWTAEYHSETIIELSEDYTLQKFADLGVVFSDYSCGRDYL